MAVGVRRVVGIDIRIMQGTEVVSEFVDKAQVPGCAAAIHDAERIVRIRPDPGISTILRILDKEADEIGAVGVPQGRDIVHVAVAGGRQPIQIGDEITAFVVGHLFNMDETQAGRDPAVGIRCWRCRSPAGSGHRFPSRGGGGLIFVSDLTSMVSPLSAENRVAV